MFNQYPDILSVDDLRSALGIGRTKAYELVSTGQIAFFKIGNAIRIPKNSLLDYVNRNSYNVADASERLTCKGGYQCNFDKHIKPYFEPKKLRIEDVTPRIIQRYVRDKEESGQSRKSIRKHLVILNGVFKEGIALGELTFNPCANVKVKGKDEERFEGTAYEIPTAKKLLTVVKGDPVEPAVYLGLFLGLRRSEVVGLRWKDVDLEKGIVHIRNTVVKFKTVSELEKTKSRASKRDLYMPNTLKEFLQTVWDRQEAERKLTGRAYSEDEHICQWADGTIFDPDYVSRRFAKMLEKNHLPKIRFHDLRHTAGSMLVNSGHTIKQVQEFLGHEKASTTLDIYSHVSLEGKKNTAVAMDELLTCKSA